MDINVQAFRLVQQATESSSAADRAKRASSRKGGLKGGPARALVLDVKRRTEIARNANLARWAKESTAGGYLENRAKPLNREVLQ